MRSQLRFPLALVALVALWTLVAPGGAGVRTPAATAQASGAPPPLSTQPPVPLPVHQSIPTSTPVRPPTPVPPRPVEPTPTPSSRGAPGAGSTAPPTLPATGGEPVFVALTGLVLLLAGLSLRAGGRPAATPRATTRGG